MSLLRRVPWGLLAFVAALLVPLAGSRFYTFVATDVVVIATSHNRDAGEGERV